MDTNRIRYFLSLVKTSSVSKAAQLHGISSPALSKAIRVLEKDFKEKLIVPDGRGILLTDRAKAMAPLLQDIISKLDSVIDHSDQEERMEEARKPLRVATFEVFSTHFMERALSGIFRENTCLLYEMPPGNMEQAVAHREVDFALTYIPIPHPELDHLRVQQIEMGIFGTNDLAFSLETPFVVPINPLEGSPNKVRGMDGWPDDAFPRKVHYKVGMLESALGICRRSLAVGYFPKFIASLHNEIVKKEFHLVEKDLPPKFPPRKEYVYLVKRKTDLEGKAAKKLGMAIRNIVRGIGTTG